MICVDGAKKRKVLRGLKRTCRKFAGKGYRTRLILRDLYGVDLFKSSFIRGHFILDPSKRIRF